MFETKGKLMKKKHKNIEDKVQIHQKGIKIKMMIKKIMTKHDKESKEKNNIENNKIWMQRK